MNAWKIYRKNGLKIAVIGMTYPWTDTMIWGKEIKNAGFRDIKSSLDIIMPEVMSAAPDIIILAAHRWLYVPERLHGLSFFEIHRIYPQIDLFLGGHVHQTAEGEITPDGGYIAAAGAHAGYTAFIHITFSRKKRVILNIYSELISTEGGLSGAQSFSDALALQRDSIEAEAGKTVAYLDRKLSHQHIQKMLCRAICTQTNADFSISALPDYVKELQAGIVRKKDIFKLEPYEDKIVVVTVSRDELKRIIGEMENLKRYNYIIAHSEGNLIEYSEKDNALNIISAAKDGEYKLAVFSFFAAGAGNRLPFLRRTADENSGRAVDSGLKVRTVLENIFKNKFPYITQKQFSEQ
jgi:2',3'-cyclic-nucleotide 2'-phosphodiesterase (5'-nucleotidase family)